MFSALGSPSDVTETVVTLLHICYRTGEKSRQDCLSFGEGRGGVMLACWGGGFLRCSYS